MPAVDEVPAGLRPFHFHGMALTPVPGGQAAGDCPFCWRTEAKFSVNREDGRWDCKRCCPDGGNVYDFLRRLWQLGREGTQERDWEGLAEGRGLLSGETPRAWGAVKSPITEEWLLPGYNAAGELTQLYRWVRARQRLFLLPTPNPYIGTDPLTSDGAGGDDAGKTHALFGASFPPEGDTLYLCEGPWDGMALWELLGHEGGLSGGVLSVPTCTVWRDLWMPLFAGKRVVILFDNDHPLPHPKTGAPSPPAAYRGVQRVAGRLLTARPDEAPASVSYLKWGPEGYDVTKAHGYDVRDVLAAADACEDRQRLAREMLGRVAPVLESWGKEAVTARAGVKELTPLKCESWQELTGVWARAFRWRQELEDVLAVMLAVAVSTQQKGDQLFLQIIGDPGSGKTRLCEALLVSKFCYPLEHLTGFHSGYRDASGEDFSLLARINNRTLVTPEADVLMSSPRFTELMSQQRRIFDGTSGASYKTMREDQRYTGLRTPWIMAGTPAILEGDQSRLGDRFLKVYINHPQEAEKQAILARVAMAAWDDAGKLANGKTTAEGCVSGGLGRAYRLTGGYVDWLRTNSVKLLASVGADREAVARRCADLADFVAYFRTAPHPDIRKESAATLELPSRLCAQFVRLTRMLAVVLGGQGGAVTPAVLGIVRKVAVDTARGKTLELAGRLWRATQNGKGGAYPRELAVAAGTTLDRQLHLLYYLMRVGVAQQQKGTAGGLARWALCSGPARLYQEVLHAGDR